MSTSESVNNQNVFYVQLSVITSNKNAKEKTLKDISNYIFALLNTYDETFELCFIGDNIDVTHENKWNFIRKLEQLIIHSIGSQPVTSNISFENVQDNIACKVKKSNSLITVSYNLYLPSETQANPVSSLEKISNTILNNKHVSQPISRCSYHKIFKMNEDCGITESKVAQLKCLKAVPSKRVTLADRIVGKTNKFGHYVSSFANNRGGHIYIGIKNDKVVRGEFIPHASDKNEIAKKVGATINKMIWPAHIGQPKQGEYWDIFFEPVVDKDNKPIPSTFVIVVYIAPCLGGVFTEEPECYEVVEGQVKKMSFVDWKGRLMVSENSDSLSRRAEVVPYQVSRISWSSDEIECHCTEASDNLMYLINNGRWDDFKREVKLVMQKYPGNEVKLMVLSKMIIAYSRQSCFAKAETFLYEFYGILPKVKNSPYFEALASYLKIILKRNQRDFEGIEELLADALAKAKLIESGSLTAAIYVLVATVDSFTNEFSRTAIEHLQRVKKPNSETLDLEQKAYITLVFFSLKCILSKDSILPTKCTQTDLEDAKNALSNFDKSILENPPCRFREIQAKLARSGLYYREAQVQEELHKTKHMLECAINCANDAKELAQKYAFKEMVWWSRTVISACTVDMVKSVSKGQK